MNIDFKKITLGGSISFVALGISIYFYRNYCYYYTFKKINDNFKQIEDWEKELEIYSISLPKFFITSPKKQKCILLIGGYKDIPHIWEEFEKYLIKDNIDFYAPRTHGNGRSFYQIVDWKDWVITYLEAIFILQQQYETIDIIGFSTGAVISVYLTQFKYKCKINNLFLCAPFLTNKKFFSIDLAFGSNIFSKIINRLYVWTFRFRPKFTRFKGYRDTYNDFYSMYDFCEIFGDVLMESVLFDFIKFRPKSMYVENVVIIYPNDDDIIGDIQEQKQIISNVYSSKPINIISIPSYLNDYNIDDNLPKKSGHLMFKENSEIINDLYINIKKYL
jgi:hypothetical protein